MAYIDLSHIFTKNMPVYPGDPRPEFVQLTEIAKEGYVDFSLKTGMHVGTHIDAPLHMIQNGKRLSEISIESFAGNGVLIDARGKETIDALLVKNVSIREGDIVLILTGHSSHFGLPAYYEKFPQITPSFAQAMIDLRVKIVGMDTPSPDKSPFPIHKMLLGNEILIIENLTNLEKLVGVSRFQILAFPPRLDIEAAPLRVVASVE